MKKLMYLFLSAFVLLASSCSKSSQVDDMQTSENVLKLTLTDSGLGSDMATRGSIASEVGEDVVSNLFLLFFEQNSNNNGLFVDYVRMDGPLTMNSDLNVDLSAHPQLSLTGSYNILAVANIDDAKYIDMATGTWMSGWIGQTQSQVMAKALAYVSGSSSDNSQAIPSGWLLMNGKTVKNSTDTKINIALMRNVVRFDVVNKIPETHNLETVSIWNAYGRSSIWNEGVMDYSNGAARIHRYYGVDNTSNTTTEGADNKGLMLGNIYGSLYAFENSVISPAQNDTKTTCLIVGLKERATGNLTYYRANIHPDNSPQQLKRNKVYRLTVLNEIGRAHV